MKKVQKIVGKVDEKLKTAFQRTIEKTKWEGGESAFVREVAETFNNQVAGGDEIARPVRLLTVAQRRAIDLIEFQAKPKKP